MRRFLISLFLLSLPAVALAKLLGILDGLYELEILVFPKNGFGWVLPAVLWFVIFNLLAWVIGKTGGKKDSGPTVRSTS